MLSIPTSSENPAVSSLLNELTIPPPSTSSYQEPSINDENLERETEQELEQEGTDDETDTYESIPTPPPIMPFRRPQINQVIETVSKRLQFAKFKVLLGWENHSFAECVEMYNELTPLQISIQKSTIIRKFPALSETEPEEIIQDQEQHLDEELYDQYCNFDDYNEPTSSIDPNFYLMKQKHLPSSSLGCLPSNLYSAVFKDARLRQHPYIRKQFSLDPDEFSEHLDNYKERYRLELQQQQQEKKCVGTVNRNGYGRAL